MNHFLHPKTAARGAASEASPGSAPLLGCLRRAAAGLAVAPARCGGLGAGGAATGGLALAALVAHGGAAVAVHRGGRVGQRGGRCGSSSPTIWGPEPKADGAASGCRWVAAAAAASLAPDRSARFAVTDLAPARRPDTFAPAPPAPAPPAPPAPAAPAPAPAPTAPAAAPARCAVDPSVAPAAVWAAASADTVWPSPPSAPGSCILTSRLNR